MQSGLIPPHPLTQLPPVQITRRSPAELAICGLDSLFQLLVGAADVADLIELLLDPATHALSEFRTAGTRLHLFASFDLFFQRCNHRLVLAMQFEPSIEMIFHPLAPFLVSAAGRLRGEVPGFIEVLADMSVLVSVEGVLLHLLVGALDPLLGGAGIAVRQAQAFVCFRQACVVEDTWIISWGLCRDDERVRASG